MAEAPSHKKIKYFRYFFLLFRPRTRATEKRPKKCKFISSGEIVLQTITTINYFHYEGSSFDNRRMFHEFLWVFNEFSPDAWFLTAGRPLWSLTGAFEILLFQDGTKRKIENNKKPFEFQQKIKP